MSPSRVVMLTKGSEGQVRSDMSRMVAEAPATPLLEEQERSGLQYYPLLAHAGHELTRPGGPHGHSPWALPFRSRILYAYIIDLSAVHTPGRIL